MTMIISSECEKCEYGTIDHTDKSKMTIYCSRKDKKYYYGQYISCDNK